MRAEHPLKALAPALAAASLALAALSSCTATTPPPAPAPVATAAPRPAPPPPMPSGPAVHWRDAPLTPGDWRWTREGTLSVARFGGDLFIMACDPASRTVTLSRRGDAAGDVPVSVITFHQVRFLTGRGQAGRIAAGLEAGDPLLDAMALSRGRFALETTGLPTLFLPSWSEVTRVVEDCR